MTKKGHRKCLRIEEFFAPPNICDQNVCPLANIYDKSTPLSTRIDPIHCLSLSPSLGPSVGPSLGTATSHGTSACQSSVQTERGPEFCYNHSSIFCHQDFSLREALAH